jgi:hypothetical protein
MTWFDSFFSEKDLPETVFEVEAENGPANYIPNTVVIEHIKQAPAHEKEQIKNVLVKIDFHNGDVNDFLEHLAQALAQDL